MLESRGGQTAASGFTTIEVRSADATAIDAEAGSFRRRGRRHVIPSGTYRFPKGPRGLE
jgi:hypothetical protein